MRVTSDLHDFRRESKVLRAIAYFAAICAKVACGDTDSAMAASHAAGGILVMLEIVPRGAGAMTCWRAAAGEAIDRTQDRREPRPNGAPTRLSVWIT